MADNLTIFGTTYNNVTGFKATDTNGVVQTFTKGGSPAPAPSSVSSGAKFIDYDGTVLHTYTTAEALALSSLPANPSHTGLTAQGWNWSLTNIKAYLTKYPNGIVNVGQMYITDDGKTRIYIHLGEERKSPIIILYVNGTVDVDWGDGTAHDTLTGSSISSTVATQPHNYAHGGDYVIKLTVTGAIGFYGSSTTHQYSGLLRHAFSTNAINRYYNNAIKKVEIGNHVTSIGANSFYHCYSLTSLTIPNNVTSISGSAFGSCYSLISLTIPDGITNIGSSTFNSCYSLTSLTIPDGVTSISGGTFQNCFSLTSLTIPDGVTSISGSMFYSCYSLTSLTIPEDVTSIGNSAFRNCYSLTSLTIPDSVTSIEGYVFYNCYSLTSLTIPEDVASIAISTFYGCYSLTSLTIPDGITSIADSAFYNCYSLTSLTIPEDVTSIGGSVFTNCYAITSLTIPEDVTSIGNGMFSACYSLTSLTIPEDVTSIGSSAFSYCYGIAEYHFLPTTPPTLADINAFNNIPADCIIYVPYSADHSVLNTYKTESNWSTYADYMQEEPQS